MTDVLKGAFDIHVHAAPDVMPRAGDLVAVFREATDAVPGSIPIAEIVRQTQEIGAEHVILASDYGKASLGSPVAGFRKALEDAIRAGLSESEIDLVVRSNPRRLLVDGRP